MIMTNSKWVKANFIFALLAVLSVVLGLALPVFMYVAMAFAALQVLTVIGVAVEHARRN